MQSCGKEAGGPRAREGANAPPRMLYKSDGMGRGKTAHSSLREQEGTRTLKQRVGWNVFSAPKLHISPIFTIGSVRCTVVLTPH